MYLILHVTSKRHGRFPFLVPRTFFFLFLIIRLQKNIYIIYLYMPKWQTMHFCIFQILISIVESIILTFIWNKIIYIYCQSYGGVGTIYIPKCMFQTSIFNIIHNTNWYNVKLIISCIARHLWFLLNETLINLQTSFGSANIST